MRGYARELEHQQQIRTSHERQRSYQNRSLRRSLDASSIDNLGNVVVVNHGTRILQERMSALERKIDRVEEKVPGLVQKTESKLDHVLALLKPSTTHTATPANYVLQVDPTSLAFADPDVSQIQDGNAES